MRAPVGSRSGRWSTARGTDRKASCTRRHGRRFFRIFCREWVVVKVAAVCHREIIRGKQVAESLANPLSNTNCVGESIAPQLSRSNVPDGTKSLLWLRGDPEGR